MDAASSHKHDPASVRSLRGRRRWLALLIAVAIAAVAVPVAFGITVTGSITSSDPTQTDRVLRDGSPSTCVNEGTFAGLAGDGVQRHYDKHGFRNTTASPQCVSVVFTAPGCNQQGLFVASYTRFVPSNPSTNWLADAGESPNPVGTYSFDVRALSHFDIVVSEVTPNAGCSAYALDVTGTGIVSRR